MPELPEVETVRQLLLPLVRNQKIVKIEVLKRRIIQGDVDGFTAQLIGRTFVNITRLGKYLFFHFDGDLTMISHLRMEGKYIELFAGEPLSRFARVVFHLGDGRRICYDDSRQFGTMRLVSTAEHLLVKEIAKLGPEPFSADAQLFYQAVHKSTKAIKELLLDQSLLTGLGNIYVDEVLFASNVHPTTPGNHLSFPACAKILLESKRVLNLAIDAGGSTIRSYHASRDQSGLFQTALQVYGRVGEPCFVCHNLIKKIKVGGRGTSYCPHCQINPLKPIVIGITGTMASGKSTLLAYLNRQAYQTISSDQIVHDLYQKPAVVEQLVATFGSTIIRDNKVDRPSLSAAILAEPKLKKQLEQLIHPLVRAELLTQISQAQPGKFIFIEVPLLFEAKFEDVCQYVVGVTISPQQQIANLMARNSDLAQAQKLLSQSKFSRYINRLDLLINNDGTISELEQKMHDFIVHIQ